MSPLSPRGPWRAALMLLATLALPWRATAEEAAPSAAAPPACAPGDRLPACQSDAAACWDALRKSPQGDPVQLACTAEAACLAGAAGACGPVRTFLAEASFKRDLRARAADYAARCDGDDKGACQIHATLLAERASAAKGEAAEALQLQRVRALARACRQGLACADLVGALAGGPLGGTAEEEARDALEAACKGVGQKDACAWMRTTYGDLDDAAEREKRCASGVARACAVHAAEEKVAGRSPDAHLTKACEAGDCASCVLRIRDDKGRLSVAPDHANAAKARAVCDAGCAKGQMRACNLTHDLHMAGIGGARDEAAAVALRLPLCRVDAGACHLLSRAWIVTPALPQDEPVAARLAEVCRQERDHRVRGGVCTAPADREAVRKGRVGCAGGDAEACVALGRRLAALSLHLQAAEVLQPSCDAGRGDACAALLLVRDRGLDQPPLAAEAVTALRAAAKKVCDAGDATVCFELSQAEAGQNGPFAKRSMKLLAAACGKGDGLACRRAADLCEGYRRKLAEDTRSAMRLRETGCKGGDGESCYAAANPADEDAENPDSGAISAPLYVRACALGSAAGCARLHKAAPTPEGAVATLEKACKDGVLDACASR